MSDATPPIPAANLLSAATMLHLHDQARAAREELADPKIEVDRARRLSRSRERRILRNANERLVCSALLALREADECREALRHAMLSAQFDALTGLPNRALFVDRMTHAIAHARRHGTLLAVLFLDLNNFKQVNDAFGHATGDEVLREAARRLVAALREEDTICRHGGDEFVVLLTQVTEPEDAVGVAHKLIAALDSPCEPDLPPVRLTISVGVSLFPRDGANACELVARADLAMYRAKRIGLGSAVAESAPGEHTTGRPAPHIPERAPDAADASERDRFPSASRSEVNLRHLQLREANEQLVLAALGFQEQQTAAERAIRRQQERLAVVAHELRGPLSPMRLAAALLGRLPAHELPRMQAIIERGVQHMSTLVNDLLDQARVQTGKLRIERRRIDIEQIVEEAIFACRPAIESRAQSLTVTLAARPLAASGDPVRLAQVFRNLLDNASKYTPDGGRLWVTMTVLGSTLELIFADDGIGVTAEALPHVFDAFAQDAHAVGFNGFGLGIGLAVVRELVLAHGGTVLASSDGPGLGSQFVITLPLIEDGVPA